MHRLRREIPSANALFVFEAAARLESFKGAADQLNVTQPAVSHAVRQLEEHLKIKLFLRHKRRVELTSAGAALLQEVGTAFDSILETIASLKSNQTERVVTVAMSTAMAAFWLLPRLSSFRDEYPGIDIRFQTVERDIDPHRENIDLAVRMGPGDWAGVQAWRFMDEEIFPICSPGYLENTPPIRDLSDLADHHILHLEEPYRRRIGWNGWLSAVGAQVSLVSGDVFTDAQLMAYAAIEGQGIGLGWAGVVDTPLRQGSLVRPLDVSLKTNDAFYIVASDRHPISIEAMVFRDWMIARV